MIWAVFERLLRLISEAGGLVSGSEPAFGVMPVEDEPDLGHPSRSGKSPLDMGTGTLRWFVESHRYW